MTDDRFKAFVITIPKRRRQMAHDLFPDPPNFKQGKDGSRESRRRPPVAQDVLDGVYEPVVHRTTSCCLFVNTTFYQVAVQWIQECDPMIEFLKNELEAAAYIVGGIAFLAIGLWISDLFTGGADAFWSYVKGGKNEQERDN